LAPRKSMTRRSGRSPYERRYYAARDASYRLAKRTRDEAVKRDEMLLSLGGAAAYGYARKKSWNLPTLGGIDPAVLYGLVLAIGVPMVSKDKAAKKISAVGEGMLTVAAYSLARTGNWSIAGDTEIVGGDVEIVGGDVEIVGDDDDDYID